MSHDRPSPPRTPDGRYIVVRGRLWRTSNPNLAADERTRLVSELMDARRAVAAAKRSGDGAAQTDARDAVGTRARAIYGTVAGAQLFARGRSDIALFDMMIDSYREAGLLPV